MRIYTYDVITTREGQVLCKTNLRLWECLCWVMLKLLDVGCTL